jgi:hypothetical protein
MWRLDLRCSLALAVVAAGGCSPSAPAPNKQSQGDPYRGRKPAFECELVHSLVGTGHESIFRTFRYDSGRPFAWVNELSAAIPVGSTTVNFGVWFVVHWGGKDVYDFEYTAGAGASEERKTSRVQYAGARTVLIEDQFGTLFLRPPSGRE